MVICNDLACPCCLNSGQNDQHTNPKRLSWSVPDSWLRPQMSTYAWVPWSCTYHLPPSAVEFPRLSSSIPEQPWLATILYGLQSGLLFLIPHLNEPCGQPYSQNGVYGSIHWCKWLITSCTAYTRLVPSHLISTNYSVISTGYRSVQSMMVDLQWLARTSKHCPS